MRAITGTSVILMLSVVFAGCFGAQPEAAPAEEDAGPQTAPYVPPAPPAFDWESAIDATHPEGVAGHALQEAHNRTVGMEPLGFYDLSGGMRYQAMVSGQYNEVDLCGDKAVVGSFAGNRGFTLVNITDPATIKAYSQFASTSVNWDVRFSPDCQLVFMAMDLGVVPQDSGIPMAPTLPYPGVQGAEDTGRGGVVIVDISRPAYPKRVTYVDTGNVHNLFSFAVDNATYVALSNGGIWKVVGEGDGRTLENVAQVPASHDVHVMRHPVTRVPYLFLDDEGLMVFDVSDPAAPELVSHLQLPAGHTMGHEQTPAPTMLDGRWVIVGAGENIGGVPEPFSVVNITDPTEPALLGSWTLPGDFSGHDPSTAFFTFSPHNVAIRDDGRVALANYHAGSWIIDISTQERQEAPVTMGFALPTRVPTNVTDASPHLIVRSVPYTPFVWGGAWADDGSLVVADLNSGLYTYQVP